MAKEQRLSQHLALRDGVKSRTNKEFTELQKIVKAEDLFKGLDKTYQKKNEDGEDAPPQTLKVRARVQDLLMSLSNLVADQLDVEATVDEANCEAAADVVVNGATLLQQVPVTTLLTLDRDLKQVREFINTLPVLDNSHVWTNDPSAGLYKTNEVRTVRTAKVQEPILLAPATEKHPAQAQLITVDKSVGEWVSVHTSGAIPIDEKKKLLKNCDELLDAVKVAKEEANSIKTSQVSIGKTLMGHIFK